MEILLWSFIFLIIFLVFKSLKIEETSIDYQQKDFINRYLEIKKIDSDYRLKHLRDWEKDIENFTNNSNVQTKQKIVSLNSFRRIK